MMTNYYDERSVKEMMRRVDRASMGMQDDVDYVVSHLNDVWEYLDVLKSSLAHSRLNEYSEEY